MLGLVSSSLVAALSSYLLVVYSLGLKWVFLLPYLIQAMRGELPGTIVPSTSSILEVLLVAALWEGLTVVASILHAGWNGSLASVSGFIGALILFWPGAVLIEIVGALLVGVAFLVAYRFEREP